MISFTTRSAICASRSVRSRLRMKPDTSSIDMAETSAMFFPLTVTASELGFSRAPLQVRHGTSRM